MHKQRKDIDTKMLIIVNSIIFGALFFITMMGKASASQSEFFQKWTAPGQTYTIQSQRLVFVSSQPLVTSSNNVNTPTLIAPANPLRSAITIVNVSTFPGVRIIIATSPVTVAWSTNVFNQRPDDMAFSSNAYPTPSLQNWFTQFATMNVLDADGVNHPYWILQEASTTTWTVMPSSPTTLGTFYPNPWMTNFIGGGLQGSVLNEGPSNGYETYVGPWYAVAIGTYSKQGGDWGMPGRVKVLEETP